MRSAGRFLIAWFGLLQLGASFANSAQVPKLDRAWKQYVNGRADFCVSYPSRWYKGDAFEGAGLFVETGVKKFSKPLGEIDVTVLEVSAATPQAVPVSLVDNFQVHLEGLRKFEGAQRMKVLEQREGNLAGNPALFTKDSFYDPQDHAEWRDEMVFVKYGKQIYRLELQCRADQVARFEAPFLHVIATFQPGCTSVRPTN
jgi:hypothetical protein